MRTSIIKAVDDAIAAVSFLKTEEVLTFIETVSDAIVECFEQGGKVLIAGNGGSLCDAMHFAEELTGQFRFSRRPLPAMALSDPGHLSCTANDFGFEHVFARSVAAFGKPGDLFVALSTSGNSQNLLEAITVAKQLGMKVVSFLGKTGGKMRGLADFELLIPGFEFSDRIQEAHMTVIHILIEEMERKIFKESPRTLQLEECLSALHSTH